MNFQAARPTPFWRGFLVPIIFVLAIGLSACTNRLALPGLQPTVQPVAVAQDERFNPTLTLDPPSGYAGVYVQVNGSGWPPNMMVVVVLTDPSGISTTVASKDTDSTGNLTTGFLYPIDSRWLLDIPYTITAESADGKYRSTAGFAVVEPGTEATPPTVAPTPTTLIAVATNAVAAAPTATTVPTTAPTATSVPQPTATPSPEAHTAEAAPDNTAPDNASQPPLVTASLVPNEDRPDRRFRVDVTTNDPNNQLRQVVAILAIPSISEVDDVRLKERDKFDVKVNKERLEINARDPQARLDTILSYGGIEVQPGQEIDYHHSSDHKFRARFDGDRLRIEAPSLLLHVFAVDATGQSYEVAASPPIVEDNDDDRDDDDRDDDRDDNGRDNRGRDNRDDRGRDDDGDDD